MLLVVRPGAPCSVLDVSSAVKAGSREVNYRSTAQAEGRIVPKRKPPLPEDPTKQPLLDDVRAFLEVFAG